MGTFPGAQNFPIRKRIIAGIALGSVRAELVPVESVSHAERAALSKRIWSPAKSLYTNFLALMRHVTRMNCWNFPFAALPKY